jgi:hypothetical protein
MSTLIPFLIVRPRVRRNQPRRFAPTRVAADWLSESGIQPITSGRDHGVHASGLPCARLVFVVSFYLPYSMQVCSANPEFDPLENVFNFQLKILPPRLLEMQLRGFIYYLYMASVRGLGAYNLSFSSDPIGSSVTHFLFLR